MGTNIRLAENGKGIMKNKYKKDTRIKLFQGEKLDFEYF